MHVASHTALGREISATAFTARPSLAIEQVVLHHLRSPGQISDIHYLRDEIDLSVHAAAGPQFRHLEKKETSAASSMGSSSRAIGSARSASCRWAMT